jgi:hypothetical protein
MTIRTDITTPARHALRLALAAALLTGALSLSASADDRRRPEDQHRPDDHRAVRGRPGYPNGYYPPPPVAYGAPYYPPPPVAYGPGVGINLPGININIR